MSFRAETCPFVVIIVSLSGNPRIFSIGGRSVDLRADLRALEHVFVAHPTANMERQTPSTLVHNSKLDIYDHSSVARKTSIICTIGPKTKSVEMITKLRQAGLNVVRMNFSHGSYEYHGEVIDNTRESVKKNALNGRPVAIALDTKGPEIRTGMLKGEGGVDTVTLEKDSKVTVTTDDKFKEVRARATRGGGWGGGGGRGPVASLRPNRLGACDRDSQGRPCCLRARARPG